MELLTGAPANDPSQRPPNLFMRMRGRLPDQAEAVADSAAGWDTLLGEGSAVLDLGALAVLCVDAVSSSRPTLSEVHRADHDA